MNKVCQGVTSLWGRLIGGTYACFLAVLIMAPVLGQEVTKPQRASTLPTAAAAAARSHLGDVKQLMKLRWPNNGLVRLVFHGHSVPAGYFKTPIIRRFDSYPVLFHRDLSALYPTAVIDVCTTAIGGENSKSGSSRFSDDVLSLKPDVVFIDYCLNDRRIGINSAEKAWRKMIQMALEKEVKVVLLTPTPDSHEDILDAQSKLAQHSRSIRALGVEFGVPVVDSYRAFQSRVSGGADVNSFLSQPNHPNRKGHEIVASLIVDLFR